jgi:hypothetical protein
MEVARGLTLPSVSAHGDFWARNLLLGPGGRAGVVDWEHARLEAEPLDDLFHFAVSYALDYPWSRYRRLPPEPALRRGFTGDGPVARAIAAYLGAVSEPLGLEREALRPLLAAHLLTRPLRRGTPESDADTALRARLALLVAGTPGLLSGGSRR